AKPFVESSIEALKSVSATRARYSSRETDLDWQIQDHGQVRGEAPQSEAMQPPEVFERQSPAIALIGERGIGKAIGHHPNPLSKRRRYQSSHMVASRGNQQERLTDRIPSIAVAFEKEPADRLGTGRSSRLACRLCRDAPMLERCHQ